MIVGVYPGEKTAIVALDEGKVVFARLVSIIGRKYSVQELITIFEDLQRSIIYIERNNISNMNKESAFNFGYSIGLSESLGMLFGKKLVRVQQQELQRELFYDIPKHVDKRVRALSLMQEKYINELDSLKTYCGRFEKGGGSDILVYLVDAFLIAEYGRKNENKK